MKTYLNLGCGSDIKQSTDFISKGEAINVNTLETNPYK